MSYSDMNGLELFGDPFSQPFSHNSYSKATQPRTTATQQKTPVQQPVKSNSTKTQLQQSQSTTNFATQAKTSVPTNTPAPQSAPASKSVTSTKEPQKKELIMDMSGSDTDSKAMSDDTAKRKAHEESEAKRKAEWEAKQLAKKQAEEAALKKLKDMGDDDVIVASIERVSTDVERITRRNMKECVAAHIQELARKDVAFARRTMHPRKNMINCFKYINRMAKEYVKQEMEDNDIKPDNGNGIYGTDVPDGLCYQWAEDYFNTMDVAEDGEKEEKFIPKPYTGTVSSKTSSKSKKTTSKAKKAEKPATNEAKKNQKSKNNYQQMSLF